MCDHVPPWLCGRVRQAAGLVLRAGTLGAAPERSLQLPRPPRPPGVVFLPPFSVDSMSQPYHPQLNVNPGVPAGQPDWQPDRVDPGNFLPPPILNGQYFSTTLVVNPVCVNLQVNQIGSLTESIQAVKMSKAAGWGVMTSHR